MRRFLLLLLVAAPALAQDVEFTSSNLPIVLIDTDGAEIPDEPKITARMRIVDNGPGQRNAVTDPPNDYDGWIGIEVRGSSSQRFPKKQYGIETRTEGGEDLDVSLLGFPEEEDWVLYAPYSDKTLMRNVLAYGLARRMGRYASRTRFCEVVLNGRYQGVYVFMEKIKRDDVRVDINKLKEDEVEGDDLTGGYIFSLDKTTERSPAIGWTSPFPPPAPTGLPVFYQFEVPDADDIVPQQAAYIEGFMTAFETAMASDQFEDPEVGYPAFIDLGSFVDFFIVTEVGRNVDGYRLSSFFHKDKDSNDPRLHAGPVWDFNLAFGNADYYDGHRNTGLQVDFALPYEYPVPFWWPKLSESAGFRAALRARWDELRTGPLHTDSLMAEIDATVALLDEAQARNFERWPIHGVYVWPNAHIGESYADDVGFLKAWLGNRMGWLDGEVRREIVAVEPGVDAGFALSAPRPNPSGDRARLTLALDGPQNVTVDVFDVRGRRVARLWDGPLADGAELAVDTAALPAGVYLVRAVGAVASASRRLVVVR
ncbi:CotH kinase family protein [Rubrivirga sp.]|uniref:CotH kinase family protein n=1 Tax=Rubrivirga sp. TaxID=1885344 RepID=UPI003B528F8E